VRPRPVQLLDQRAFPILYVDDEPDNLRVFELTFRRDFSVLTATSADEGMEILNANPVAVVLSDQRMPGVTGVEFLSRVRDLDPDTLRILVTAYGDAEILGDAINDGSIYRYIPKPWEPEDMRITLRRAIEVYALERERTALLQELSTINRLSRNLHQETEMGRLVDLLLNSIHKDLGFDGGALFFFDETGDHLAWKGLFPAESEVSSRLREIDFCRPQASNFMDQILLGRTQHLSIADATDYEGPVRSWLTEVSADEILIVPLTGKKGVIGALAVDNRSGSRRFVPEDSGLLDGLATQAVIALENARLVQALRESRAQVQRADRLGTLGTLAAGLAHEINNPLVSVNTFLNLVPEMRSQSDESFWVEYHRLALGELDRIRGLVGTMSRLGGSEGGSEPSLCQPVNLAEVVREGARLMDRQVAGAGVDLVLKVDEEASVVLGVRDQLHQVFLNLVLNAVDATEPGGSVEVEVSRDPSNPGEWALIHFRDHGQGISLEHLERIFDPFFTTKGPNKGSGLGLMIVHQIVSEHGGSIQLSSELSEGTIFQVRLPLAGEAE
jgi:signal transduction histidine kinase/FixJ family two-component response regulator